MNFLPLTLSLAAGIYLAQYLPVFIVAVFAFFLISISFITARKSKRYRIDVIFAVIAFMSGMLLYNSAVEPNRGNEYDGDYVTLYGCVCSIPYDNYGINRYTVYAEDIEFNGSRVPFKSKILVNSESAFQCGDNVVVFGKLKRIENYSSDGAFNSQKYYASRDIYFKTTALTMTESCENYGYISPSYTANLLKSKCAELVKKHYDGDIAAAMIAIITGHKHEFSDNYASILTRTGTRHLFYPSFIHITLISFFIGIFSSVIPRRIRDTALVIILILYMLLGGTASSLKAGAVFAILILCKNLFGSGSYINSISLFTLVAAIANPMLLFDAGFVYSIVASVVVRSFMPLLSGKNSFSQFIGRYLIFTVGLAPLTLYFFGRISVYSFLASTIFIPLLTFILATSPLFMLNCLLATPIPFAWISHKFIMVLLHIPILINKLPYASLTLQKPTPVFIFAFYFLLAAIIYSSHNKKLHKLVCIAVSAGLFCSQFTYLISDVNKLKLHFIDVGQGDAALIQLPFRSNILIDGGGSPEYSNYNIGENVFLPYLNEHGVNSVDAAFVSHYHKDHTEGIIAALKSVKVKNIYIPDVMPENEIRLEIEQLAEANGTKVWHISKPTLIKTGGIIINATPASDSVLASSDENDTSLYIEVCYGKFNAVFTGDMTRTAELDLLSRNVVNEAEALKVAHHGSPTSSCTEMIAAISPEYALIGVGENNEYGHPAKEVLTRLNDARVLRTDKHGNILLRCSEDGSIEAEYSKH